MLNIANRLDVMVRIVGMTELISFEIHLLGAGLGNTSYDKSLLEARKNEKQIVASQPRSCQ